MRYVIAMVGAIAVALLATLFISSPLAGWVVAQFEFESSDEVSNLHDAVFMASNVVGLLIGWGLGWVIGGRLLRRSAPM
jgi:hypothetical protein